eukprot:355792-Chlamydomonas_euryale.AAC.8
MASSVGLVCHFAVLCMCTYEWQSTNASAPRCNPARLQVELFEDTQLAAIHAKRVTIRESVNLHGWFVVVGCPPASLAAAQGHDVGDAAAGGEQLVVGAAVIPQASRPLLPDFCNMRTTDALHLLEYGARVHCWAAMAGSPCPLCPSPLCCSSCSSVAPAAAAPSASSRGGPPRASGSAAGAPATAGGGA